MAKRQIRIEGDIAYVPLTQGYEAIIDAEDHYLVSPYQWRVWTGGRQIYAITDTGPKANRIGLRMHRVISGAEKGDDVDHIDHDGLNNRRINLRVCSRSENLQNQRKRSDNSSGLKGVSYYKRTGRWRAYIMLNGKETHLGYFDSPEDAHLAYCEASKNMHGDYGFAG